MSESTRRVGEAKSLQEIFEETNSNLLTNIQKGMHLDGGGKISFYEDRVKELLALPPDERAMSWWQSDYDRMLNIRKSSLKRFTLLQLRIKSDGKNVTFEEYEEDYQRALEETLKHPKKLKPNQDAGQPSWLNVVH